MWPAVLLVWGSLLLLAASESCPETSEDPSSWVRLKPLGHCRDGENTCPYRLSLPPLTIQLPRPFRDLEKMARELQSLKQIVNQLKSDCQECKEKQRMQWSTRTTDSGEDGERTQASRGTVNTKERQQDLPKREKVIQSITQEKDEEDTVLISNGSKQVTVRDMEKQRWNASLERTPSSIRHRGEISGGTKASNPEQIKTTTGGMSKLREPVAYSSEDLETELQSPRTKMTEPSVPGQDKEQQEQVSRGTFNSAVGAPNIPKKVKVVQGTVKKPEEDTALISKGTTKISLTGLEKRRWNSSQERNLNSTNRYGTSRGPKGSNPTHMERRTETMSKVRVSHTPSGDKNGTEQIVSPLIGHKDKEQPSRYEKETSRRPKGSSPAHLEGITDSTSKAKDPFLHSAGEKGKEVQAPGSKVTEAYLPENLDEEKPTQGSSGTVIARVRQQDLPKNVKLGQGTTQKTEEEKEEDSIFISHGTKEVDPTGKGKQRWDPDNTGHKQETSGGPEASKPAQPDRGTDRVSKVTQPHIFPTVKYGEVLNSLDDKRHYESLPGNQDKEQPTQGSSGTANPRVRQQDVHRRVNVVPSTTANPRGIDKHSWGTTVGTLNQSGTEHREETSGEPKGPNKTYIDHRTDSVSTARGPPHLTAAERGKDLQSSRTKQILLSLPGKQNEKPSRPHQSHTASSGSVGPGQNTSRTLIEKDMIRSRPKSVVTTVSEETEAKQLNPPKKDKPIRRFPGRPGLISPNRKEIRLNPNSEDKFANPGAKTKVYSPTGDRTMKTVSAGSRYTPVRKRPNEKRPHKADSGWITAVPHTKDQAAKLPDNVRNSSKLTNRTDSEGRQPVTDAKAQNNREPKLDMTEVPKTIFNLKGGNKEDLILNMNPVNTVETVSGSSTSDTGGATFDVRFTTALTQGTPSESSYRPSANTESDTGVDLNPITPAGEIRRPGKVTSSITDPTDISHSNPSMWDRRSETLINPQMHFTGTVSAPPNTIEAVTISEKIGLPISGKAHAAVDVNGTKWPQSVHKKDVLPKGPDLNTTRRSSEEDKLSKPVKALKTDSVKTTSTARDDKTPVERDLKPGPPAGVPKVRGRFRPSRLMPLRTEEIDPHPVNSTTDKGRARELNQPHLKMVKNVTRAIPSHVKKPERITPTKGFLNKNPKQRRPYIFQREPGNDSTRTPLKVNFTTVSTQYVTDPVRTHPQTEDSSFSTRNKFKSSTDDMTPSVSPTVAKHPTVEKIRSAPTAEAFHPPDNHRLQNPSQNTEIKLFHVADPENPGGKRGLDPITDGVKEKSVETAMNQNTVSRDSNRNRGPDSHQAAVEKTKSTDKGTTTSSYRAGRKDSTQENKESLRAGGAQNIGEEPWPTVEVVITERNELNHPTTTASTYTTTTTVKDKHSQMTPPPTPIVTTPQIMAWDHVEKSKNTSPAKVSSTHIHHRVRSSSQDVESKRLTGTRLESNSRNKEQHHILHSTEKAERSSKETVTYSRTVDSVPDRASSSNIAGPKGSTPSSDSTLHAYHKNSTSSMIISASLRGNNGNSNEASFPIAVDRARDTERTSEETLYKSSGDDDDDNDDNDKARLLNINNMDNRDDLEDQTLSTCHGQCDPPPTPQPVLNTQRSSQKDKDKPPRDCFDLLKKNVKSGIYNVTPAGSKSSTFRVFCDMEASGGGWTLIQNRFDGRTSFNRSWDAYKRGFGNVTGEFWLGNDKIHWLTTAKAMVLRIELEDLDGVKEYAQYERFKVANESHKYRLSIGGYSGTAGNAMQFSKKFNHDQKNFTTPDRDNDRYPSGNCGAYYSSGWWFDACMAANLNGKYYRTRYKGVRNGIYWGTWHNISNEYYPTNDRQAFKKVRMMVRPRTATARD